MLVMIASPLTPVQAQEAAGDEGVSARSLQACAFGEVDWEEIEKSLAAIEASEFIDDDELVEVTPQSIRLRKKLLTEVERKRDSRMRA